MHDVFISYQNESKIIADKIVATLEKEGVRCWYAPRDVIGDYATSIVEAIQKARVFVLILNGKASKSPHVLNEVEIAYKMVLKEEITIVPLKVDSDTLSMAMEYYVKRLHWIDAVMGGMDNSVTELLRQVRTIIYPEGHGELAQQKSEWDIADKKEVERLTVQTKILSKFDNFVYDKAISGKHSLTVLDLGTNDGLSILHRIGKRGEIKKIIGLEINEKLVEIANQQSPLLKAYQCDIDQPNFAEKLAEIMAKEQIKAFDLVVCSLVLHHTKNNYQILRTLRRNTKSGGTIIISDIDDGNVFAYPDTDGKFAKTFALNIKYNCHETSTRLSGRRMYSLLRKAGYTDVTIEKSGYTIDGLTFEEKEMYFHTCFYYILKDLKRMATANPNNRQLQEDYEWLNSHYYQLEQEYLSDDFFYQGASMLFTARKK